MHAMQGQNHLVLVLHNCDLTNNQNKYDNNICYDRAAPSFLHILFSFFSFYVVMTQPDIKIAVITIAVSLIV